MTETRNNNKRVRFSWYRTDLEARLGLHGGRFTRVNNLLCFLMAVILAVIFYSILSRFPETLFAQVFTQRGVFQYVEVLVAFWAFMTVLVKYHKIRVQKASLAFTDLAPAAADFVLSPATVEQVLHRLRKECDDPERFILFRRIQMALSNLRNMGQVGDLDDVLESLAANDEDVMESSYTVIKGLIWAIPVLGFVGTVQGLSEAIGTFGGVLGGATEIEQLRPVLQGVTAGLSTAFDTTFVALVAALGIHLILIMVRKSEEEFMTDCKTYCQRHLIGRLRLMRFDGVGR